MSIHSITHIHIYTPSYFTKVHMSDQKYNTDCFPYVTHYIQVITEYPHPGWPNPVGREQLTGHK